ncbi:MAG: hypothetical protein U0835_03415 [Isosphaeraceae bacterium]
MQTLKGKSKAGKDRELVCSVEGGKLGLWVRSAGDEEGGYQIMVAPDELLAVLARVMMEATPPGIR